MWDTVWSALGQRQRHGAGVFALGSTGQHARLIAPYRDGEPHTPDWDAERAIDEGYKACGWVYRCVAGKAELASSVPWRVWQLEDEQQGTEGRSGKAVMVPDHPYAHVLEHPSDNGAYGRVELISQAAHHLELAGNALIRQVKIGPKRDPKITELIAEVPIGVRPIADRVEWIRGYEYDDGNGSRRVWPRDIMIHARLTDPGDPRWGMSRLQALVRSVSTIQKGETMQLRRLHNDGRPSMVVTDESILDRRAREEAEDRLRDRRDVYQGGFMVLGGKQQLHKMGMSEKDLGLLETLGYNRDLIVIAFGYLPAGFSNDASTYNNIEIFVRHEWQLASRLNATLADAFTRALVPKEEWGQTWVAPDYSEVEPLQRTYVDEAEALEQMTKSGVTTDDAARVLQLPLPPQPGGDVVWRSATMVPDTERFEGE